MEFNFERLLAATVIGGSTIFGGAAVAYGLTLPSIGTPSSLSVTTPTITVPAESTPSEGTPSESVWADVPGIALPVNGVGMSGDVHDWSLDQTNGTPPQHAQAGVPAVTVPSITVPSESVSGKAVDITLPASAHVDPASGTADATASAAGRTVGVNLH
jgi:hypothetical protein